MTNPSSASTPKVNTAGRLAGQVAIVTGASRGIGTAIAARYAQEGAKVIVTARTLENGDHVLEGGINAVAKAINDAGGQARAIRADLNLAEHRARLVAETEAHFGPVDILVNNGAITYYAPVHEFSEKRFKLMMEVQVWAPYHLSQMVLPGMLERQSGRILNISSHAALHPAKDAASRGGSVYGMCKAALERFSTGLAAEVYEHNIGVNVISPGLIATPGAVYHNLINDDTRERETPVEHMAEACLHLVTGDPRNNTGAITYADDIMREHNLSAAELIVR